MEASEARVRELEADAMLRSLDEEASFSSAGSREPYDLPFDRDWVRLPASIHVYTRAMSACFERPQVLP